MPEVIGQCPFCGDEIRVTRMQCAGCQTNFEGTFSLGRFQSLAPDQLAFLEVFVKNRGVIRDVERELGISYPTVRSRLDDLIRALGFDVADETTAAETADDAERRRSVLEQVSRGEITAEQALKALKR